MKDEKAITINNAFQKLLKQSNRKPNTIWVDEGSEFYNRTTKSWLEGNSVVSSIFIRTLKNKIYKYKNSISRNVYIDKLDEIVNKYSNIYHITIKMKLIDVNPSMYIDSNKENNKERPKFKVGDHVRILKYNNIFAKGYVPN